MLITLLTAGSRGDTQPYVALGQTLKKAGFKVRIAAPETFKDLINEFELEFYSLPGDISIIARDKKLRQAMSADNPLKIIMGFNTLKNYAKNYALSMQQGFYNACLGSDAIVYHPGATIGHFVAQELGIPSILATPFPMTPTKEYPALIFYDSVNWGKQFNFLTHKLFERVMWQTSKSSVEQFWQQKFNCIPPNFSNPFAKNQTANYLTLVGCSERVFSRPQDWSERVQNTEYWFLDRSDRNSPIDKIQKFLQAGIPPVYVGFGSLGDPDKAAQTTRLVIDALQKSRQRGILATGWGAMKELDNIPESILIVKSISHAWLFPQMSAVVHHGGAGTTAAGLRAGIPSIIIPHANDQFAWGKRVYELGVGCKPIPRKKLTAEKLSAAINYALAEKVRVAAKALSKKIQQEKGTAIAAKLIVDYLKQKA